jgi:hypothetical protein
MTDQREKMQTIGWSDAMTIAERGFDAWAAKEHNRKWVRKIDGTPIKNDLLVDIATAFAEAHVQPAPIAGLEPVQETWFSDRALPVLAMSGDVENDRALKLHFRRPVTDADRRDLTDALNLHIQHSRGQLYTRAQLEAHAAEQVRPLVEALEGLIEAVELDADEGLEGIGSYTGARLTDAKNAIRARGQV